MVIITPSIKETLPYGKIVYEYNPFHNLRDENKKVVDFETKALGFDIKHPVSIECQPSYDGSVNLILNDGLNSTKCINSRFSVRENNTYEIVDRTGNADTNIYDNTDQFESDTSLSKKINQIPKIEFSGLSVGGNLPIGNYHFYFKYSDEDGNETDFVAESGTVVCHIGNVNDPLSIRSGIENENSGKIVYFTLSNLDDAYEYVKIYYSRQTSSAHNEPMTEYKQIVKDFKIRGKSMLLSITGFEETLSSTLEQINLEYFNLHSAKSVAQCKNRLFLANVSKPSINYQDFQDISLRMLPYYTKQLATTFDENYNPVGNSKDYGYYDTKNIYKNLGYWNEEIYRLGVVYILQDNSLTPVFNIRGANTIPSYKELIQDGSKTYAEIEFYADDNKVERNYIIYDTDSYIIEGSKLDLENSQGVVRIYDEDCINNQYIYSLGIYIDEDTKNHLASELKVKGLFFVRQKRMPTILAQAFVLACDQISGIPLIPIYDSTNKSNTYKYESFVDKSATLSQDYSSRLVTNSPDVSTREVAICPDYTIRQELYNNFFTDTNFVVKCIDRFKLVASREDERHYFATRLDTSLTEIEKLPKINPIIGVPEGTSVKRTRSALYCSKCGTAESYDFTMVGKEFDLDYEDGTSNREIVRGIFSSFIGIGNYKGDSGDLINIYIPDYSINKMSDYFRTRYEDQSPYYAISDRMSLEDIRADYLYRGDCYICQYTQRLNRNFQDLSAPTADIIVDGSNWYYNYRPESAPEKLADINIGDLNAVRLGSWITFTVRSNNNLCMRNDDSSYIEESLLTGVNRSFYPLSAMSTDGNYKIPESTVVNTGINAWNSEKVNFIQPVVPAIKNNFQTRICYSDIAVTDAFKNGYRSYQATAYRDYPTTYGGIMKIIEVKDSLLVIFEHGIGLAPINERVMSGGGSGGNVFINSNNVLPETLNMITTDYGTQWPDSVIQTPHGIYGLDTIAKKIWVYKGHQIELLSDDRMQKFLNDNITISDTDVTPIIGIRNVKTHYNAFKKDVMFTFYDCKDGFQENVWNLCYNEYSGKFITFYSWVPSFSTNIDNIFFSFDRDTSKKIAKLAHSEKDGIKVSTCYIDGLVTEDKDISLSLDTTLPKYYQAVPSIESTILGADAYFDLECTAVHGAIIKKNSVVGNELQKFLDNYTIIPLNIKVVIYEIEQQSIRDNGFYTSCNSSNIWKTLTKQVYFTNKNTLEGYYTTTTYREAVENETPTHVYDSETQEYTPAETGATHVIDNPSEFVEGITTDFWKHGQGGLFESNDNIRPCNWYGKSHPFEFEYSVNVSPDQQKTFDNMQIISNNVKPESFHYEIVGDTYDFADDKLNMYVRQELTKHLYQLNGSDITYNPNYIDLLDRVEQRPIYDYTKLESQQYPDGRIWGYARKESVYKDKSTLFPGYYSRQDTLNEIYDSYVRAMDPCIAKNYSQLSGGEIKYDPLLNQFSIINHVKAIDIKDPLQGRLRGNVQYQNDRWNVQINPLNFVQKNENWTTSYPPINVKYSNLLNDIVTVNPSLKPNNTVVVSEDWGKRKEAKLKDKYMKVKIRYSGDKLALITGVRTMFRI